jgi:hypothetical protein
MCESSETMNAFLPETEPNPAESLHFAAVTIRVWGVGKYFGSMNFTQPPPKWLT